jgi:hypothetical protein
MEIPRINSNHVFMYDDQFKMALEQIQKTCEVALKQGPLSRRNALVEIEDMARVAVAPR